MSDSSRPHGLQPTRLLCPWDFPGKSTGVGRHCCLLSLHLPSPQTQFFSRDHTQQLEAAEAHDGIREGGESPALPLPSRVALGQSLCLIEPWVSHL